MDRLSAPVAELVAALTAAGVQASTDPAELSLPAAWVAFDSVSPVTVVGQLRLSCRVFLIVPDTDPTRALELLGGLYDEVLTVLTPDGPVTTQGVVMPGDPTPLPALVVPVNLYT